MTMDEQGRPVPPWSGSELDTLVGFLDYQRATLEWKTRGLSAEQLRVTLPTSAITLGGLLTHMACVEAFWFVETMAGGPAPEPFAAVDWRADPDFDWNLGAQVDGEEARRIWNEAVEQSRAVLAELLAASPTALDETKPAWGGAEHLSLRWVLVHMIEEYARHNGHADLLREAIDGQTGE